MKHLVVGACALLLTVAAASRAEDASPMPFIVVDQFGYLPDAQKIAIVRDPETGFDNDWRFTPGAVYQVVDVKTQAVVYEGRPLAWNNGALDPSSGDHAWSFDFSSVTAPGSYVIRDKQAVYDSVAFDIAPNVYKPVLVQAVRAFFYQRAGSAKAARFAGEGWADKASHLGHGQDAEARLYSRKSDKTTDRDLHGGWYDAGDFNKYTSWTADYVVGLLSAYAENPQAFSDDFNIPESGNGVPDLLDEVKWGVDWLMRMQTDDGSVLSVVGLAHASPPSSASGPSYYGPVTTSASYATAAAMAYASQIFGADPRFADYAVDLKARAIKAFAWAQAHPSVTFYNNDPRDHSEGLAAGQQEPDAYGRSMKALSAAIYLYSLIGDAGYRDFADAHYRENHIFTQNITLDFDYSQTAALLYYATLKSVSPKVAADIRRAFAEGFKGDGWAFQPKDPYRAHISSYGWGSNSTKSNHGNIFADEARYAISDGKAAMDAAAGYIHYIHGVNPLGKVYLSNMGKFGAENSVDRFYHTWFTHGSSRWDSVKHSTYGPPPGFLVGGANPGYTWERRCPAVSPMCGKAPPSPPVGQPAQKAYADFNESWPINSWEVTENSGGYQTPYIRLLARFVK